MDFLSELNEAQRSAVTTTEGPVMIIAGPGSGKTRVLTYRIACLIGMGIDPFRILSLTFTNKASAEMRERIQQLVGPEARNLYMGTFHSVFARILRIEHSKIGYPQNFTIYDADDSKSLLKAIIKEEGLNDKLYKPNIIQYRISSAKNSLLGPEEYKNQPELLADDESAGRPKTAYLFEKYCRRCFLAGAMDFDDLLLKMHEMLEKNPEVLYKYQHRFTHLLVDEFQDTNFAQYEIIKKLAAAHENICVVGDDAQSIYAFRGATIDNILHFERDYPDLKVFKLEQNYRSTGHIVKAANDIIRFNRNQLPKTIWTDNHEGEKIKVVKTSSESDEARYVSQNIFELKMRQHLHNSDFAILYRTNAQSRALEEALRRSNIPYRIYGGLSFYQRKEIKDLVAYLRVVVNPHDEEALKRIINYPTRGIGDTTIDRIIVAADEKNSSIWDVLSAPQMLDIPTRAKNAIQDFYFLTRSWQAQLKEKSAYEIASEIGKKSGLIEDLYRDKTAEGVSRYENIQELLNGIKEYTEQPKQELSEDEVAPDNDLSAYLQQISLLTDADRKDDDPDKVKLMTVHAAKGLEFPCVFVVGLEENLFPSILSLNSREELEEERRLFYVAITRAKDRLHITYATTRFKYGTPTYGDESRFIEELGKENMDMIGTSKPSMAPAGNNRNPWGDGPSKPWYLNKESEPPSHQTDPVNMKKMQTASSNSKAIMAAELKSLAAGMEVMHEKFDKGKVVSIEGIGDNKIATIFFQVHGQKKIMLKFAKLQIL